jgi:hypothetical protein
MDGERAEFPQIRRYSKIKQKYALVIQNNSIKYLYKYNNTGINTITASLRKSEFSRGPGILQLCPCPG